MKKRYLLVILFFLLIMPFKVWAIDVFTYSINDKNIAFKTDYLEFNNIHLIDNTNNSSKSFGLTGKVINNNDEIKEYETKVIFYDRNNIMVAESTVTHNAIAGEGVFTHTLNASELKGRKISDISYFNIAVNTSANNNDMNFTPSEIEIYKRNEYVIDKYNVVINVNENNSFDIEEYITAYFNVRKHGIIRNIPTKNMVTRLDGSSYNNRAKIKNISVNEKYTTSKSGDTLSLKIGNASTYLTGKVDYVIKYNYQLSDDKTNKFDELYYNIIGTEWDTVIGNVTFTINMPKKFDETKLGFSKGVVNSTNNEGIVYSVKGNTITGQYNGILGKKEGITVRCELPEGYFIIPKEISWEVIVPIVALVLSGILWFVFGRNALIVDTVEFYPPDNLNSLEIGALYKGNAERKDVVSLLIYLASKGYIKIQEVTQKIIFSKYTYFKIYKLKEYDGSNSEERKFFNKIFYYATSKEELDGNRYLCVSTYELKYSFYSTINTILKKINGKEKKKERLKSNIIVKIVMALLAIISIYFVIFYPIIREGSVIDSISFIIVLFYVPFYYSVFKAKLSIGIRIAILLFIVGHNIIMLYGFGVFVLLFENIESFIKLLIGIACIIGITIIIAYTKKRTEYGAKMLGRIKGFKNFLVTAEKEKLEAMVMENPTYFYDILPYTYVLGVSNKWIKKFEDIAVPEPNWYTSDGSFNIYTFNRSFNHLMNTTTDSMTSTPSSSGGGGWSSGGSSGGSSGSSGGGSSGGGSGGGGGSSW